MNTESTKDMVDGEVGLIITELLTGKIVFRQHNSVFLCCVEKNTGDDDG
jgi:hypothetical protein